MANIPSEQKAKIRDFVLKAFEQHGEVPKRGSVAEALGAPESVVSGVFAALRFAGRLPQLVRDGVPKGRVRGANAVMEFLAENNRLPTAEEIGVTPRVLRMSINRLVKQGKIQVQHQVVKE